MCVFLHTNLCYQFIEKSAAAMAAAQLFYYYFFKFFLFSAKIECKIFDLKLMCNQLLFYGLLLFSFHLPLLLFLLFRYDRMILVFLFVVCCLLLVGVVDVFHFSLSRCP